MKYFDKKIKKIIYIFIGIFIVTLFIIIISLLMLKYEVEGENNMPFQLSQMVVISTAEGIEKQSDNIWDFDIVQNNDVCIYIERNKGYKETEKIKNITINNFKINKEPSKGKIVMYKPSMSEHKNYEYNDEYIINNELKYNGDTKTNIKEQKIANQGGVVAFRYCTKDLRIIYIRSKK